MQDIQIPFKDHEHYSLCLMATDSNHSELFSKILKYLLLENKNRP
jgi:hypothetical protein